MQSGGIAVLIAVALVAAVIVTTRATNDQDAGPWQAPLWPSWPTASVDDACGVGVCVADTVALPLARPIEAAVDLEMPEELGALSIERLWVGERAGLFGTGWATIWDVHLDDGLFTGPLPAAPAEAPRRGHEVELEDGSTVRVDGSGRLEEVCLDAAMCTRAEWTDDSLVLRAVLGPDRELEEDADDVPSVTLALDHGRVVAAGSDDGREVEYRYASGLLGTVVHPDGKTTYGYETGRLASIDDGVRRTFAYGDDGRVVSATDIDGDRWTIGRPGLGGWLSPTTKTDRSSFRVQSPQGWTRVYRFAGGSLVEAVDDELGVLLRRDVDDVGRIVEERPVDGLRTVRTTDRLEVVQRLDDGVERTVTYRFDDEGRVVRADSPGGTTTVRYDGRSGRPTETSGPDGTHRFQYDEHGLLIAAEDADGYEVRVERNDAGQPVVLSDGVQRTEFSYDEAGRAIGERSGGSTTAASYRPDGMLDSLTSASGDQLPATYDDVGRLKSLGSSSPGPVVSPDGAGSGAADPAPVDVETTERADGGYEQRYPSGQTVVLDAAGRPVQVTVDGRSESRAYDEAGRLVELDLPGGPTYELSYTEAGRVASVSDGTVRADLRWHGDLLTSAETSAGSTYEYTYDEGGRVESATSGPMRWDYTYDAAGRSSTVIGPAGVVATKWDDAGRPIEVRDGGHLESYRWAGEGLDLDTVETDGEEALGFERDEAGRVVEISQADSGTARLGYDPGAGTLTSYRLGDGDTVTIGYGDDGRVTTVQAGDRSEMWTWSGGEVTEVRVEGEDDPYHLGWIAPGLLGRVERGDEVLLRTTTDDAGRPTTVWEGDDVAAALTWTSGGLAEASLADGPSATIERDDEQRPTSVDLDDRRVEWQYEAGALAELDDGDRATAFSYDDGRLRRTTLQDEDGTSAITWDPSLGRPVAIETTEGEATFRYADGKAASIEIDGEDQELRYEDGRADAAGDGGDLLDALFDETGRYRSPIGRSLTGPSAPWFDSLPAELAVSLPEVVTGRQVAQAAIEGQLPAIPGFIVDDPDGLADRTARGLVAASVADAVLTGPDQLASLGLEVDGDDLTFEFDGAPDALAMLASIEIMGPGPGLVDRVVAFGKSVAGMVGRGLQAAQRFFRDDPWGRTVLEVAYFVGDFVKTPCVPCNSVKDEALDVAYSVVTAQPGDSVAASTIAAVIRPYRDLVDAVLSLDPVATVLAASAFLPLPGSMQRFARLQAVAVACGLSRMVCISAKRFGAAADHVADAQRGGAPRILRIDRPGAAGRRSSALRGMPTRAGFDRDEYPFALSSRRSGLSVRYIDPASNRALGAYLGEQTRSLPDGAWFYVVPIS